MIHSLGLDIGGANLKISYVSSDEKKIKYKKIITRYFPIWRRGKNRLLPTLRETLSYLPFKKYDIIAVTMTAELSDIYFDKKEGVNHILDTLVKIFPEDAIKVLNVRGELLPVDNARRKYIEVASANWYATGWFISKLAKNAITIDIGSTTTSIIVVHNGIVYAKGLNDLEKLRYGELVYTGALRTNLAAIVHEVPYRDEMIPISSEYFAQSADINLILGNISEEQYIVDTPDGRGTSYEECLARIARVICGDLNILTEEDIIEIAKYIYNQQVKQVIKGLERLIRNITFNIKEYKAYLAGIGGSFLGREALEKVGFKNIYELERYIGYDASAALPSYALAVMGIEYYKKGV